MRRISRGVLPAPASVALHRTPPLLRVTVRGREEPRRPDSMFPPARFFTRAAPAAAVAGTERLTKT